MPMLLGSDRQKNLATKFVMQSLLSVPVVQEGSIVRLGEFRHADFFRTEDRH